jgi:hypothetical protein
LVVETTEARLNPELTGKTLPIELLMKADVAPVVVHVSVEDPPPKASEEGFAESVQVGAG